MPYVAWSATKYGISGDYTLIRVVKMVFYPDTSFWFLWVLFFINLIFIFSQWLASRLNIDELVVIALSSLLLLGIMVGMEFRMFGFQFIAYYFVFYTMGYCIHRFPRLQIGNGVMLGLLFICWTLLGLVMEYARVANVDTCHTAYTEFLVAICVSRCDCVAGYLVLVGDGSQVFECCM